MLAASHHMHLTISNVSEQLFSGDVVSVTVPGMEGEMTLLPHHEALITLLQSGKILVRTLATDTPTAYQITGGILETSSNQITILV